MVYIEFKTNTTAIPIEFKTNTMGMAVMILALVPENPEDPSGTRYWKLISTPYGSMYTNSQVKLLNELKVTTNNPDFKFGYVWYDGDATKFSNDGLYGTNTSGTIVKAEILASSWEKALGVELYTDLSGYPQVMVAIGREC